MPVDDLQQSVRQREAELTQHKLLAGGLLVLAAAGWLTARFGPVPVEAAGWLRAGCEAALVGGLADWFAVTALFRRPLGLPIPHTALIPRNQKRIADGVARYIDHEFLQREMLVSQLRRIDVASRIAGVLESPAARERVVDGIVRFLPKLLRSGRGGAIGRAGGAVIARALSGVDLRPALAKLLRGVTESDDLTVLLREGLGGLRHILAEQRPAILNAVRLRTGALIPAFIDEKLADMLLKGIIQHVDRMEDPSTAEGEALRRWIASLPDKVANASGEGAAMIALKRAMGETELSNLAATVWVDLERILLADLESPESRLRAAIAEGVLAIAEAFGDAALRREVNTALEAFLAESIPAWRVEIRAFITETLERQEPVAFARRLELQVGADLQYVRINGTILGAIIGLVIHAI